VNQSSTSIFDNIYDAVHVEKQFLRDFMVANTIDRNNTLDRFEPNLSRRAGLVVKAELESLTHN